MFINPSTLSYSGKHRLYTDEFPVNLWNLARFKPAYVRAYLALSNDAFQMLLDTEMSAFVEVTNVVLFPGL